MDWPDVHRWVERYEQAWRKAGTAPLVELFSEDASYRPSPWKPAVEGIDAIGRFWEAERDGPDEDFDMGHEVVAVDGDTAVVRVEVRYGAGVAWRDLWVIRFAADGRCVSFEEWPFAPDQDDGHPA